MAVEVPGEVRRIAKDIKTMRIRGAGRIARAAARALMIAAQEYNSGGLDEFLDYKEQVARLLVSTRPTAVSLPNAVNYVMKVLRENKFQDIEEARKAE